MEMRQPGPRALHRTDSGKSKNEEPGVSDGIHEGSHMLPAPSSRFTSSSSWDVSKGKPLSLLPQVSQDQDPADPQAHSPPMRWEHCWIFWVSLPIKGKPSLRFLYRVLVMVPTTWCVTLERSFHVFELWIFSILRMLMKINLRFKWGNALQCRAQCNVLCWYQSLSLFIAFSWLLLLPFLTCEYGEKAFLAVP